jgi:drug/metabolite transporter (DMT)-like permease
MGRPAWLERGRSRTTAGTTGRTIVVMVLWAACFPLISAGLDLAPHLSFATLRAVIAGGSLLAIGLGTGRPWPHGRRTWLLVAVAGLGATTIGFLGMFHAAEYVAPGTATVIANTQPLLAAALGHLVLRERVGALGTAGLALGFVGIVIIAAPRLVGPARGDHYLLGIGYIILAAFGITVANVVFKHLAGTVDPVMATASQLLIGAVPLAVAAAVTESPSDITWSSTFLLSLFGLALPGTALVFWLWLTVLETTSLTRANAFTFLVPLFGFAMGIVFYAEDVTALLLVGMAVTIAGIVAVNRDRPALVTPGPDDDPAPWSSGPRHAIGSAMPAPSDVPPRCDPL